MYTASNRATGGDYIHRKETEMMLYVRKQEMVVDLAH